MHVLIATDGSDLSVVAARRGVPLLAQPTRVTLLTVLSEIPGEDAGGFQSSVLSADEQDALWTRELADAGDELQQTANVLTGVDVEKRIEVGDVAHTICRVAETLGADAVIIGSHGRTGIKRVLLGSVSEHVVRHAPCPVLVVRESPDDARYDIDGE